MIKSIKFTLVKASSYYSLGSVRLYDYAGDVVPIEFTNRDDNNTVAYFYVRNSLNTYGWVSTPNSYNTTTYGVDNPFDTSRVFESWHDRYNYWLSSGTNNISINFVKPVALSKLTLIPYCGDDSGRKQNSVTVEITLFNNEVVTKTFDTSSYLMNQLMTVDIVGTLREFDKDYDELFLMKNVSTNKYYSTETIKQEYYFKMINPTTQNTGATNIKITSKSNYDGNHREYRAFMRDMPNSYGWVSQNGGGIAGQWLQVDFGERRYANWVRISTRNYQAPNETLKDFDILGSYDGVNFKVVAEIRDTPAWQAKEVREFKFQHPKDYRYYRILVHANHGLPNYVTIGDVVYGYTSVVELDSLTEENFKKYSSPLIEDFNLPLGSITKPIHKEQLLNNNTVTVALGERPKSIKLIKR